MSLHWIYQDRGPTGTLHTWEEELTDVVRLGSWALTSSANKGAVSSSSIAFDDVDGTLGHDGDQITGDHYLIVYEDEAPADNQRIFTGYTKDRTYESADSLVTGSAVRINVELAGLNESAHFQVCRATHSPNRPAETVGERLTWLLATTLINFVDDGLVVYPSTAMDARDYTNQTGADVLDDCMQAAGYNWFQYYNEAAHHIALFFDDPNTSSAYSSTLRVSSYLGDIDSNLDDGDGATHTWAPLMPVSLKRSPETVAAGENFEWAHGTEYVTRTATLNTFGPIDTTIADANVTSAAKAIVRARRILLESATEEDLVTIRVKLPAANVNDIREGQVMQARFRNMPGYTDWTYFRVLERTVGQEDLNDTFYTVSLTLSPQEQPAGVTAVQHVAARATGFGPSLPDPVTVGNVLLYLAVKSKSGNPQPPTNSGGGGPFLGGSAAWTQIGSFVTSGAGDVWTAGAWAKVANGTENGQSNPSGGETECIVYELSSNADIAGAVFAALGSSASSTNIDLGSLGTPDPNVVALMAIGQYTTDMGSMSFTPDTGWSADWTWTTPFFGDARPYWLGHIITDGSAVEAKVTSSVSFPFAGIAVLLPSST